MFSDCVSQYYSRETSDYLRHVTSTLPLHTITHIVPRGEVAAQIQQPVQEGGSVLLDGEHERRHSGHLHNKRHQF